MAKRREVDGNAYVDMTLGENQIKKDELDELLLFIQEHKSVYLYGNGACGKGLYEYLQTCKIENIKGFLTSETFEDVMKEYKKSESGIVLSLKSDYYRDILPMILKNIDLEDVFFLGERTKQIFVQTFSKDYLSKALWITLPLSLHCNINCASCNMFSPLCGMEYYHLEDIEKDLKILKSLDLHVSRFNVSGGEPFLNPEALDILTYIRELYPKKKIDVYTNGILLAKYSDEEFLVLKKCQVELHITEYGIETEKLEMVYKKLEEFDIDYIINYIDEKKLFYKKVIDFNKNVPVYDYINCQYYTFAFSLFLFNGRLFKCPMALNVDKINQYAPRKLEITDKDYLQLSEIDSQDKLYNFWRSRLPMCGYCPRVTEAITWKKSERKIEEWM